MGFGVGAGLILLSFCFVPANSERRLLFAIAAPLPLLTNLSLTRQALLQANGWIARSQWPLLIFAPGLSLGIVASIWLIKRHVSPVELVGAAVFSSAVAVAINSIQLRSAIPPQADAGFFECPQIQSAMAFMWIGALYLIMSRIDLLMLGALKGNREAGIYGVAARIAELVPLFLTATSTTIGPAITRLHHQEQYGRLEQLLRASMRRVLILSTPIAVIFFVVPAFVLRLAYGSEYTGGYVALRILTIAQFAIVLGGPSGAVLNMTGHEKLNVRVMTIATFSNLVMNFILIPLFGAEGAALSTCINICLARFFLRRAIRKQLGLRTTVF